MTTVFDPLRLGAVALDVMATSQGTTQALLARQQSRLKNMVASAMRGSAYYQASLQNFVKGNWQLSDLPVVQKKDLMAQFDRWVTDTALRLDNIKSFLADSSRIAEPLLGKYLVWESSGSSHEPGIFVQDAQSLAVYDALEALRCSRPRPLLRWLDPLFLTDRIAFVGATEGHFSSFVSMQRMRQINPFMARRMRCFSMMQPLAGLVEALNRFTPTVIATYPSVAVMLADTLQRGALQSRPKEIWLGGETLSSGVRQYVEKTMGCSVRNNYGASEFMALGWECASGQMHANTDWLIFEPVDENGNAMPAGQQSYTTLLTHLANHVQPLIRYDLGDQITMQPERCLCGSPLPVIQVTGRKDEALVMQADNGSLVTLLPMALTTVLEEEAEVFDFQIEQVDASTLKIQLPAALPNGLVTSVRCARVIKEFAARLGLPSMKVETQTVTTLSRSASGKAQRVVSQRVAAPARCEHEALT
jgi:phenylacetate-CoA ligase